MKTPRRTILLALAMTIAAAAPPAPAVLDGHGLIAGGVRLAFGKAPRAAAIAAVAKALGKPLATGSHGECGQGSVIGYARFAHDFELSFVKGRLSGWTEDSAFLATDRGVRVGSTVAALRKAYPDVYTNPGDEAEGGTGPSFQSEAGPSGWLDGVAPGAHVAGMFAGATCLPGI